MEGVVYKIENSITLDFYVGSTIDYRKRINTHKSKLKKGNHSSKDLQKAYDEYGLSNFNFEIIRTCEDYRHQEQLILSSGVYLYNASRTASGGDMISNHPNRDEIIKRSIEVLRNCKKAPIYGEENPNWKGGVSKSSCSSCGKSIGGKAFKCKECYFKERDISNNKNPFFGKKHSDETRIKLRESRLGVRNVSGSNRVVIYGKKYLNVNDASLDLNIKPSTIRWRVLSSNPKFKDYKYLKNSNDYPEREYTIS